MIDEKNYVMHGKLTIRDVTKEVVLPVQLPGVMEHPRMKGKKMIGLRSAVTINRNEYGVESGTGYQPWSLVIL